MSLTDCQRFLVVGFLVVVVFFLVVVFLVVLLVVVAIAVNEVVGAVAVSISQVSLKLLPRVAL